MPSILKWARQIVRSTHSSTEAEAAQAASDYLSDAASREALDIAAEISDHQRRQERITEVTLQVADKYRMKPSEGQAIVATTNETTTSTPSQDVPRVVQFRTTNQDEAISALIGSLDRRIGKRLEELNQENAGLRDKITELTGVIADFATKNSELERTVSGIRSELGNTAASLERVGQEKTAALETISRLEREAISQREEATTKITAAEAEARAKIDAMRVELQQKPKGGSKLAWVVAFLVAAASVAFFLS